MKTRITLLLLTSLFVFTACPSANDKDKGKKENNPKSEVTETQSIDCESLLIIAEDRSGSTTDHRKLNEEDYKHIIDQFQKQSSGQVAARVIGNPAPTEREFFILNVEPTKPLLDIPKDAKMSTKGKLRKDNEAIIETNNKIQFSNKRAGEDFVADRIAQHIINYKPFKNKDITNIEDALHHLEMKVNEPTFKDYDKIDILIISDGIHDATKLKENLRFNPKPRVNIYLIGWKDKSVFNSIANVDSFESVDGFISYYKKLTCKK